MSDLFNEKADDWDANDIVKNLSRAIGGTILQQVNFNNNMQVMDFGAGTGLISAHIAPLVSQITAVDISQSMLDQLVAKPELSTKVKAVCQDITQVPLNAKFDAVTSAMALHHVEDTANAIQTFAEHLKTDAILALADLDKEDGSFHPADIEGVFHDGFERDALQSILEENGFKDVQFVTAHNVNKEGKEYSVFLVTAVKA